MKTNRRELGFTLIELLVVIAIIAILAAILFPVFAKAREKARQSTCQSNLKQIGLAIVQYSQDYDEFLPAHEIGSGATYKTWREELDPYAKSEKIFYCPSSKYDQYAKTSYGDNYHSFGIMSSWNNQNLSGNLGPARLPQINRPSEILMLVDTGNGMNVRDVDQGALGPEYTDSDTGKLTNVSDRHNGGANVLFVDGHVKWMMKSILADPALPGDIWGRNSY